MTDFNFEVKHVLWEAEKNETNCFRICIINWGKGEDKIDFRNWYKSDPSDDWKPGKGAGVDADCQDEISKAISGVGDAFDGEEEDG